MTCAARYRIREKSRGVALVADEVCRSDIRECRGICLHNEVALERVWRLIQFAELFDAEGQDTQVERFELLREGFRFGNHFIIGTWVGIGNKVRQFDPIDPMEDEVRLSIRVRHAGTDDADRPNGIAGGLVRGMGDSE